MPSVLITGANRGLGLEFAKQYAADGWDVIATARVPAKAKDLQALAGTIEVLPLVISETGSVKTLAQHLKGRPLTHVIANAGMYGGDHQSLANVDYEAWAETFATNTMGPFRLAAALLPNLQAAKAAGETPKLVFITSQMGSIAQFSGGNYIYCSSKAALNLVGHGLAAELQPQGIVTLLLHPGWVQTDMGGQNAPLTPPESIKGLRKIIAGAGIADTGHYLDYQGQALPW